jgi:peptidoglycan/LPS O-acetylase OafA/YrhL
LIQRVFESRPLVFCGRISYGLYLWHWPIFVILIYEWDAPVLLRIGVAWCLTFLLATLSYEFVERRFMTLAKKSAGAARPHWLKQPLGDIRPALPKAE